MTAHDSQELGVSTQCSIIFGSKIADYSALLYPVPVDVAHQSECNCTRDFGTLRRCLNLPQTPFTWQCKLSPWPHPATVLYSRKRTCTEDTAAEHRTHSTLLGSLINGVPNRHWHWQCSGSPAGRWLPMDSVDTTCQVSELESVNTIEAGSPVAPV